MDELGYLRLLIYERENDISIELKTYVREKRPSISVSILNYVKFCRFGRESEWLLGQVFKGTSHTENLRALITTFTCVGHYAVITKLTIPSFSGAVGPR